MTDLRATQLTALLERASYSSLVLLGSSHLTIDLSGLRHAVLFLQATGTSARRVHVFCPNFGWEEDANLWIGDGRGLLKSDLDMLGL